MSNIDAVPMINVYDVHDTFVSGLGNVEELGGGMYRFVLYAKQETGGREERVIVAKLLLHVETAPAMMRVASKRMNLCICAARGDGVPLN